MIYFTTALTNERNHNQIRLHGSHQIAKQRRFPNARPCKDPNALALRNGQERIEEMKSGSETRSHRLSCRRRRRRVVQRQTRDPLGNGATIKGLSVRINHTPDPGIIGGNPHRSQQRDTIGQGDLTWRRIRQHRHAIGRQAQNITVQSGSIGANQSNPVPQTRITFETGNLNCVSIGRDHATHWACRRQVRNPACELDQYGFLHPAFLCAAENAF
ncbi:MAG: hypothetical protein MRY75_21925 [Marivita sp.]|nr:hypothetical protein [Marivita sp.]MCI5113214.1 hypothetical protein [Marivita sp.]